MATVRMTLAAAGLLVCGACGLAFANGTPDANAPVGSKASKASAAPKAASGGKTSVSGRMQVEEPKAAAPMSPARESKAWQKSHSRGLTDAQKKAFRERKESMEGMIAVIKEKRKALRDAKPEERAALARELHSLILEKDPAAISPASPASTVSSSARVGPAASEIPRNADKPVSEAKNSGQASQRDSKREEAKKAEAEEAAEYRRKRIEAYQEQLRKKEEIRKEQVEKRKSSLDNSLTPAGGLSQGNEED